MRWLALIALFAAQPALGEVVPRPGSGDPHIQQVDYDPEQVVALDVVSGFSVTVELSPDERVENIAVGDSVRWQVQVNHRGDRLFLKPVGDAVTTNMTVITDVRRYNFLLRSAESASAFSPYVVRFIYAAANGAGPSAPVAALTRYKLHGKKNLWPIAMSDDGHSTTIAWAPDDKMPAVYRVDERGEASLVNGLVRDGAFVVEGVSPLYRFKLGKDEASATRKVARKAGR